MTPAQLDHLLSWLESRLVSYDLAVRKNLTESRVMVLNGRMAEASEVVMEINRMRAEAGYPKVTVKK